MPRLLFVTPDGLEHAISARCGLSLLEAAQEAGFPLEGACEGSLACSTCHVIVDPGWFDRLVEPSEEEEDMLDLAWGLSRTSRLGCQITVTQALDGLRVRIPAGVNNHHRR